MKATIALLVYLLLVTLCERNNAPELAAVFTLFLVCFLCVTSKPETV